MSATKSSRQAAKDDKIKSLPGLGGSPGTQFAGYASIYGPFNPPPAGGSDEGLFAASQTHVLGYIQDGGLLCRVKVLNAGHMAAMDQPRLIQLIVDKLPGDK